MITTACHSCGKIHRVPAEAAGRRAKCTCGCIISIPIDDRAATTNSGPINVVVHQDIQRKGDHSGLSLFAKITIGFGVVAVIAILAIGSHFLFFRDRWENQHRNQIEALVEHITMTAEANPHDADVALQELTMLVRGHKIREESLRNEVDEALAKSVKIKSAIEAAERTAEASRLERDRLAAVETARVKAEMEAKSAAEQKAKEADELARRDADLIRTDPATHFKKFAAAFIDATSEEVRTNQFFSRVEDQYSINVVATNSLITPYTAEITGTLTSRDDGKVKVFRLTFGASDGRWQLRSVEGKDFLEATLHGRDVWENLSIERFGAGLWVKVASKTNSR